MPFEENTTLFDQQNRQGTCTLSHQLNITCFSFPIKLEKKQQIKYIKFKKNTIQLPIHERKKSLHLLLTSEFLPR